MKRVRRVSSVAYAVLLIIVGTVLYVFCRLMFGNAPAPHAILLQPTGGIISPATSTVSLPAGNTPAYPLTPTAITARRTAVIASSSAVFDYAHGTAVTGGRMFVGSEDGVTADSHIVVFYDPPHLGNYAIVPVPHAGAIETMAVDTRNRKVYFVVSAAKGLLLYSIDPYTLTLGLIASTTDIDAGPKPAIITDGTDIYGITNTLPSYVFKVHIADHSITSTAGGHVAFGHAAALLTLGSSTDLYVSGNADDRVERVRTADLTEQGTLTLGTCHPSDDMAAIGAHVYVGCEGAPYGYEIDGRDLSVRRFSLPGASLGIFAYGGNLYNASRDGHLDIMYGADITRLTRYAVDNISTGTTTKALSIELNEILYDRLSDRLFFTAWWGVPGMYEVSTTTLP